MKKRAALLCMAFLAAVGICGCTGKEDRAVIQESEQKKLSVEGEFAANKKSEKEQSVQKPVPGVDDDGYEGFQYLVPYKLESDNYEAVVYLPDCDYAVNEQGSALAEKQGVWVNVQLETPLMAYETNSASMEECLADYVDLEKEIMEEIYEDYTEIEMSEVRVIDDDRVVSDYSYLLYDSYAEKYTFNWGMYYLVEVDDGRDFLFSIEVHGDSIGAETEDILEEMAEYLQIDIDYDKNALLAKAARHNGNEKEEDTEDGNEVSTGFWTFELPEGWEKDTLASTDDQYIFAPGGRITVGGGAVAITEKDVGEDVGYIRELDEDKLVQLFELILGDELEIDDISVVGDTAVGYTVKIELEEMGINMVTYLAFEGQSAYLVAAMEDGTGTEAFEVAEHIINTAKIK
ncbi:MAG: hypothetical protein HDR00_12950 [Lachnospiraceae bacterium]|nr:hypothetical protein [Lachnospiraceae bacterium]